MQKFNKNDLIKILDKELSQQNMLPYGSDEEDSYMGSPMENMEYYEIVFLILKLLFHKHVGN